jgi:transcriptional regulator with GAF, ATPase, and Fis domain
MRLKRTTDIVYCWETLFTATSEETLSTGLAAYFDSKKNIPDFPFVILADHIPSEIELSESLSFNHPFNPSIRPIIVALKKKCIREYSACWQLLDSGINDVIEWEEPEDIINYLESKYKRARIVKETLSAPLITENLVGSSQRWQSFLSEIIEATLFSQASILLIGESGTGKELISRLVHTLDTRPDKKKIVILDCTTIVKDLSGSELFGHERGSYTSAVQSREGAFALANGGTLFLDEVGELPLSLQAELLRVMQEGTYKKVGSNAWQKTDFRLIAATNKDLRKLVDEGRFRQDLYFRIADCEFRLPPLRERKDDIPALVDYFFSKLFAVNKRPVVDKLVMEYLVQRNYPGNVRELKQLVQRIALKHVEHKNITIGEVPAEDRKQFCTAEYVHTPAEDMQTIIRKALLTGEDWWKLKDRISETAIQVALDLESNNKQKAADRLGVDVRTVQQYVKRKT